MKPTEWSVIKGGRDAIEREMIESIFRGERRQDLADRLARASPTLALISTPTDMTSSPGKS